MFVCLVIWRRKDNKSLLWNVQLAFNNFFSISLLCLFQHLSALILYYWLKICLHIVYPIHVYTNTAILHPSCAWFIIWGRRNKKITRYKVHFHILYLTYMTTNNHFFFRWGEEKKLTLWRIYMRSRRRFIIDQKENMTEYVASHGGNNVRAVKLKINSRLITMWAL